MTTQSRRADGARSKVRSADERERNPPLDDDGPRRITLTLIRPTQWIAEAVRDHLAHEIWQGFICKRRDRHPAHSLRRAGACGNVGGIDHELQRKMREDMGDDS